MNEVLYPHKTQRKAGTAVILSLLLTGLGQIYCGRFLRGIIFMALGSVAFLPLWSWMTIPRALWYFEGALVLSLVAWLIAAGDAYRCARRTRTDYQLKDYNHGYVYILLLLICTGNAIHATFSFRQNVMEAFRVAGNASYPTLWPGDQVLANKHIYKMGEPQRGELVILENPDNRREKRLKRIIALAGDTVEIQAGEVYVNDQKLPREALPEALQTAIRTSAHSDDKDHRRFYYETTDHHAYKIAWSGDSQSPVSNYPKIVVPKNQVFVLGDNRDDGADSRLWGPIHVATIKGRVEYLYFPTQDWFRFGKIK